jgi:hypothetical protein
MSRPTDIPQDIWEAAIKCAETALRNLDDDYGDMTTEITAIARTIMAEREHCAAHLDERAAKMANSPTGALIAGYAAALREGML